jgi:hypothetical protein
MPKNENIKRNWEAWKNIVGSFFSFLWMFLVYRHNLIVQITWYYGYVLCSYWRHFVSPAAYIFSFSSSFLFVLFFELNSRRKGKLLHYIDHIANIWQVKRNELSNNDCCIKLSYAEHSNSSSLCWVVVFITCCKSDTIK